MAGLTSVSATSLAATPPRQTARQQLRNIVRLIGDASGKLCPTHYWGTVFALSPGQTLKPLFRFEGNQLSQWHFIDDGLCRKTSDTVSVFRDLSSNNILRYYDNPFTGQRLEVQPNRFLGSIYHYSDRGIWMGAQPTNVLYGPELSLRWMLDKPRGQVYCDRPYNSRFGYPFGESRIFSFNTQDLSNNALSAIPNQLNSVSTLPWPRWMAMGDRPGVTVFHATGVKYQDVNQYPADLRAEVQRLQPGFYDGALSASDSQQSPPGH